MTRMQAVHEIQVSSLKIEDPRTRRAKTRTHENNPPFFLCVCALTLMVEG